MTIAALATPFLFYGLEFWEHTLALGKRHAAAALFCGAGAFSSGLLFGVAAFLRPEAVWFGVSVVAASRLLSSPPPLRAWHRRNAGALVALVPLELYLLMHFGTLMPPHVIVNAVTPRIQDGWQVEPAIASSWFISRLGHEFLARGAVPSQARPLAGSGSKSQGRRSSGRSRS